LEEEPQLLTNRVASFFLALLASHEDRVQSADAMSYLYSLPTTGSIKFTSLVSDPTNAHSADLARATAARNRVRAILKETRRVEAANKDWLGCATVRTA